uniref:odorant receptor 131-2-like n=1 Tax=Scatophagus argus TaxID=75038 RepID=UPI001ED7CC3B|nr:odorant receptor 131-2-like [Scatophagus argus]
MEANNSQIDGESPEYKIDDRSVFVQVLVALFLCINFILFTTFLMKAHFYTTMRYILFAITLLSDCAFLVISNVLLILTNFQYTIQMWPCLIIFIMVSVYTFVTPVTLTAMTLERYVAICMPLRHAELCSTRSALYCILIIHGLSSVPCIIILSIFFSTATLSVFRQNNICTADVFTHQNWQSHLRSAVFQFYFLIMFITIIFCYVKIMKVAKAASGENKKSTWKGLRTVILHAFQLLLCITQFWCPFIEEALLKIDYMLFAKIRYFNYIMFNLIPRCLSPLIYGLRDDKFFLALKHRISCGFVKNPQI